ncbi:Xenobiotic-transporting ATPase [Thalassoporum mexicanum PCC 7367]|nr:Xenobiotic-transporting ATPase [Pseudanabaena sp. PCC 7367]
MGNMPKLFKLVWTAAPGWLVLNLIMAIANSTLPVANLYVSKLIVDRVVDIINTSDPTLMPLLGLVGLALGISMLQDAFNHGNFYVSRVLSDKFSLHANSVLLKKATALDLAHYESSEFHDILNRAQESGSFYPMRVLNTITQLVGKIGGAIGLVALLLRFNPLILLLLLVTTAPAFWQGVKYSGKRFWMLRHQTQSKRLADYFGDILTSATYVKEVRLFNLGDHMLDQYEEIRDRFNQESRDLAAKRSLSGFAIGVLANVGFYGAYGLVLWQAVQRLITLGDLTMYTGAFQRAQGTVEGILTDIAAVYEYNLYVSQYFEFLSLKPKVISQAQAKPFPQPLKSGLRLEDVSFTYPGASEPTLHHINLQVSPGECIALVGVNGSGKTTLLKLITRFYDVDRGKISFDRIPIQDLDLTELRSKIGVLFQDFARYALSVEDNIGFGDLHSYKQIQQVESADRSDSEQSVNLQKNTNRIHQAASNAGAAQVVDGLDHGYQTILGKIFTGGVELSGGQWQKIGLARAFMSQAQVLILDEPTAAVDAIAEHDLFQRFRQLTQDKMTFLVSHRFSTVRMADRIVVLEAGRIVETGSHDQLIQLDGLYAQMFNLQAASYQVDLNV